MTTLPEFVVTATSDSSVSVGWNDGAARYHFWLDYKTDFKTIQGGGIGQRGKLTIYKNPPLDVVRGSPADHPTRYLDATSKTWEPIVTEMIGVIIARGLVAKAFAERDQKELIAKIDADAKRAAMIRNAIRKMADEVLDAATDGPGETWHHLNGLAKNAPDLTLRRLAHLLQGGQ